MSRSRQSRLAVDAVPAILFEPPLDVAADAVCASSTVSVESSALESTSSTPPTSISDACSQSSETTKLENITVAVDTILSAPVSESPQNAPATDLHPAPASRPRRARAVTNYNLSYLSGTSSHGRRAANGDVVGARPRAVSDPPNAAGLKNAGPSETKTKAKANKHPPRPEAGTLESFWSIAQIDKATTQRSTRKTSEAPSRRPATRLSGAAVATAVTAKLSSLGKRRRKTVDEARPAMDRELKRLQDTDEFARIDHEPVVYTVWSNGKFVPADKPTKEPARKKAKLSDPPAKDTAAAKDEDPVLTTLEPTPVVKKAWSKKYLEKGLYAGQPLPSDYTVGLTTAEKKRLAQIPELKSLPKPNKTLPLPMYNGLRLLAKGRDFKLPFDVCNPLPPGQPKPDEWRKMTKNRFIGDSKECWRKTPHHQDLLQVKCVCKPEDGCGESCENRTMLYECDDMNCNIGRKLCTNRAFASLAERKAGGGKYRIGVEVIKTADRGYGVRSNRCFEPNQIIMEYAGEIITEDECQRRMTEVYRNNACYYLMSFDQNMIIDATTGSIARFVNHSCDPNCHMIKWIVGGQPRMALFAGDRPIMTGEELTYDYKFDPFSAKNVQACLCGSSNCRGVLGPKPKEAKGSTQGKADAKSSTLKTSVKAGKRKLKELVGNESETASKKRKTKGAVSVKKTLSSAGSKAAKGAKGAAKGVAAAMRKGASAVSRKTKGGQANLAGKAVGAKKGRTVPGTTNKNVAGSAKKTLTARKVPIKGKVLFKGMSKKGKSTEGPVAANKKASAKTKKTPVVKAAKTPRQAPRTPKPATTGTLPSSSPLSTMVVVASDENASPGFRASPMSKAGRVRKLTAKAAAPRPALDLSRAATTVKGY